MEVAWKRGARQWSDEGGLTVPPVRGRSNRKGNRRCSRGWTTLDASRSVEVQTVQVLRLTAYCKAAAALNTRRGGLKAKRDEVNVEDDEGSVYHYQSKKDVQ